MQEGPEVDMIFAYENIPYRFLVSVQADLTKLPVVLINDGTGMPFKLQ
jgi:hypothetical protein